MNLLVFSKNQFKIREILFLGEVCVIIIEYEEKLLVIKIVVVLKEMILIVKLNFLKMKKMNDELKVIKIVVVFCIIIVLLVISI